MSERYRVLHVAQPTVAGVPAVLQSYVRDQLRRGWSVAVACPTDPPDLVAELARWGAEVLPWPAGRAPGPATVTEAHRLARIIEATDPRLVHLHSSKAGLAGRLVLRAARPTVFQPHGWSFLAATGAMRAAAVRWERLAARWTAALVCVSAAEVEIAAAAGIRMPATIVRNGVDVEAVPAASQDARRVARRRLGLPDAPTAVCVGRLCRQKGQDELIATWPQVRQHVRDAQLVLVGDGPDRAALVHRAAGRPDIRFAGARSDVPDWLAAADVVVAPSRWEGMALVPLEAMACARSVVATDVAGMAEAVPVEAGAIVPLGDRSALAAALGARLADSPRADAEGAAGRAHVVSNCDAAQASAAIADIYARLLGEPATAGARVPREGFAE